MNFGTCVIPLHHGRPHPLGLYIFERAVQILSAEKVRVVRDGCCKIESRSLAFEYVLPIQRLSGRCLIKVDFPDVPFQLASNDEGNACVDVGNSQSA